MSIRFKNPHCPRCGSDRVVGEPNGPALYCRVCTCRSDLPGEDWYVGEGRAHGTPATVAITEERKRQVSAEGWTEEHDDEHVGWELARAASCYIAAADYASANDAPLRPVPEHWPWEVRFWKPTADPVRMLVKAGALLAAEADRLMRAEARSTADWAEVTGYEG